MSLTYTKKAEDGDINPEQIDHFEKWTTDSSYFGDYDRFNILRNELLVRIYLYSPVVDADDEYLLDEAGIPYSALKETILPLAKVIKVGKDCQDGHQVGDILVLPDGIALRSHNPDYLRYIERQDERPIVKGTHPPVFIYGLEKWQHMMFIRDKIVGYQKGDEMTFIIPETFVKATVNYA